MPEHPQAHLRRGQTTFALANAGPKQPEIRRPKLIGQGKALIGRHAAEHSELPVWMAHEPSLAGGGRVIQAAEFGQAQAIDN